MKAGQRVTYVERGRTYDAEIVGVPGSGPSGWKTLDLQVGQSVREAVPHERDKGRKGYWREHAPPAERSESVPDVPSPVVPESKDAGRATAGEAGASEDT